jgi:hypothetical protein
LLDAPVQTTSILVGT